METYYRFSVPIFINALSALREILSKGAAFAKEKGVSEEVFLESRLAVDMFPLKKQIQIASVVFTEEAGECRTALRTLYDKAVIEIERSMQVHTEDFRSRSHQIVVEHWMALL